jgi:hypothetical protein
MRVFDTKSVRWIRETLLGIIEEWSSRTSSRSPLLLFLTLNSLRTVVLPPMISTDYWPCLDILPQHQSHPILGEMPRHGYSWQAG